MTRWNSAVVVADSTSQTAGDPSTADIAGLRNPTVCVSLEDLEGSADDTATIEFEGDAGWYRADERTLSATESYTVAIPQASQVRFTSSNGVTYSVEVRANPE